jgi:hypothetical protein
LGPKNGRGVARLPYPLNFEQMPLFGGCKAIANCGDASKKAFVQSDFSVNKWFSAPAAEHADHHINKQTIPFRKGNGLFALT